jgi:hypothetical protein
MNEKNDSWVELGKSLMAGQSLDEITLNGKKYKLSYTEEEFVATAQKSQWPEDIINLGLYGGEYNGITFPAYKPQQSEFISNFKDKFALNSGGFGSGKSLALYIKLVLMAKCFPHNRILMGRRTLSDIDRAVLPDLFDLMPKSWYEYRVKDGTINFSNGSQIVLFGLDAMQSGGAADIKKAQQKLKSLNLGAYFIDQLEEVEYPVFETLNSRIRKADVPMRQGNATTNPANYWGYHFFVGKKKMVDNEWVPNPQDNSILYESSMLHNPHLPGDYIMDQLSRDQDYVKRFVKGQWDTDVLIKGSVFAKEHLKKLETFARAPVETREGCQIWELPKPNETYQIGVDPSEGVTDPSSVSVVSVSGKKVAKFNGYVTIPELADKIKLLHYLYNRALIIPEVNRTSIIEHIKDLRVYYRKTEGTRDNKPTEKLGFMMNWATKKTLITTFLDMLRHGFPKIYDRATIEEMKAFVWSNEATHQGASASRGFHDDDVISTLLAFHGLTPSKAEELQLAKTKPKPVKRFQYK